MANGILDLVDHYQSLTTGMDIPGYQHFQVLDRPNVAGLTYGDSPVFQAGLEKASKASPYSMGLAALAGKIQSNPVAAPVGGGFYAPSLEQAVTNAYGGPIMPETVREDLIQSEFVNPYGHEISHLGFDAPQLPGLASNFSYMAIPDPFGIGYETTLMGTEPGTIVAGSEELPNYIHDAIYGNQPISQHLIGSGYAEDGAFAQQAYEDLQSMGLPQWQLDAIGMGGLSPYTPGYEGGVHAASAQLSDIQQSIAQSIAAQGSGNQGGGPHQGGGQFGGPSGHGSGMQGGQHGPTGGMGGKFKGTERF